MRVLSFVVRWKVCGAVEGSWCGGRFAMRERRRRVAAARGQCEGREAGAIGGSVGDGSRVKCRNGWLSRLWPTLHVPGEPDVDGRSPSRGRGAAPDRAVPADAGGLSPGVAGALAGGLPVARFPLPLPASCLPRGGPPARLTPGVEIAGGAQSALGTPRFPGRRSRRPRRRTRPRPDHGRRTGSVPARPPGFCARTHRRAGAVGARRSRRRCARPGSRTLIAPRAPVTGEHRR